MVCLSLWGLLFPTSTVFNTPFSNSKYITKKLTLDWLCWINFFLAMLARKHLFPWRKLQLWARKRVEARPKNPLRLGLPARLLLGRQRQDPGSRKDLSRIATFVLRTQKGTRRTDRLKYRVIKRNTCNTIHSQYTICWGQLSSTTLCLPMWGPCMINPLICLDLVPCPLHKVMWGTLN